MTNPIEPTADRKEAWEISYLNRDNFLFYPHEEVIRFVSKYIRRRVGLSEYVDRPGARAGQTVLDLGCGIGRHVIYCHDVGLQAFGIDLSEAAIGLAREWATQKSADLASRLVQGDVRRLPWEAGTFNYAISHGVLDSMTFKVAREACIELARVMAPRGLFYCDLVSGDDSRHAREYTGEEIVTTPHEKDTVQLYFNMAAIRLLFDGVFEILECNLIRREEVLKGGYTSRYHLVLRKV